jgi:hypothetical protein
MCSSDQRERASDIFSAAVLNDISLAYRAVQLLHKGKIFTPVLRSSASCHSRFALIIRPSCRQAERCVAASSMRQR